MRRHQGAKVEHFDVGNVIYHKFSHGAVSYTLNGENVNVMLELRNNFSVAVNYRLLTHVVGDGASRSEFIFVSARQHMC